MLEELKHLKQSIAGLTAHIVKEYVEKDKNMHLKYLPSYALELNDQENIWKWLRKRVTHNFLFENLKALGKGIQDSYRIYKDILKKSYL